MLEPTRVTRKMCGKIFILANDIFSLVCEFCGDDFQALEDFRSHLSEHFPESPTLIKNEDSSISFDSDIVFIDDVKYNLTDDLQADDSSQSFVAVEVVSPSILLKEENMKTELKQDVDGMKVEYIAESDESSDEIGLKTEKSDAREVSFQCDICQQMFPREDSIREHMMAVHTTKQLKECLNKSVLVGAPSKPNKCNDCGKSFATAYNLTLHRRQHTGEQLYKCDKCNQNFAWKAHFIRHTNKPHNRKCIMCSKTFSTSRELNKHYLTDHGERPHKCSECSKIFSSASAKAQHMTIHIEPLECSVCSKSFSYKKTLTRHMKIHTGYL